MVHTSSAQGLPLVLYFRISHGRVQGPFGVPRIEPRLAVCKESALLLILSYSGLEGPVLPGIQNIVQTKKPK